MIPTNEYLAQRLLEYQGSIYAGLDDQMSAMVRAYSRANKDLIAEMERIFAKYSKEGSLSLSDMYRYGRLEKLNLELVQIGQELGSKEQRFTRGLLTDVYTESKSKVSGIIGIEFVKIPRSRIKELLSYPWSGADFSERIWRNKTHLVEALRDTIVRGAVRGDSFSQMTKALQDRLGASYSDCKRLVRTESMFFINQAQLDAYGSYGVEQVEWLAANDRTCDECMSLDGKIYKTADAPMIPLHPNCRCTYIPVLEERKEKR